MNCFIFKCNRFRQIFDTVQVARTYSPEHTHRGGAKLATLMNQYLHEVALSAIYHAYDFALRNTFRVLAMGRAMRPLKMLKTCLP